MLKSIILMGFFGDFLGFGIKIIEEHLKMDAFLADKAPTNALPNYVTLVLQLVMLMFRDQRYWYHTRLRFV